MKRFWKEVTIELVDAAYAVRLEGRALKTPLRNELVLPSEALAKAIEDEWACVADDIDPRTMPMTGFANVAIDRIGAERQAFVSDIAAYGETDLFCYRADEQEYLALRQAEIWDPWIEWAQAQYGISFVLVAGIMHKPQSPETLTMLQAAVAARSDFEIAAMAKLSHLSGSLIATMALVERAGEAQAIWDATCLDEDWQAEQWGLDDFAIKNRRDREVEFIDAARFLELLNQN